MHEIHTFVIKIHHIGFMGEKGDIGGRCNDCRPGTKGEKGDEGSPGFPGLQVRAIFHKKFERQYNILHKAIINYALYKNKNILTFLNINIIP